jgi:hypothetical protein
LWNWGDFKKVSVTVTTVGLQSYDRSLIVDSLLDIVLICKFFVLVLSTRSKHVRQVPTFCAELKGNGQPDDVIIYLNEAILNFACRYSFDLLAKIAPAF